MAYVQNVCSCDALRIKTARKVINSLSLEMYSNVAKKNDTCKQTKPTSSYTFTLLVGNRAITPGAQCSRRARLKCRTGVNMINRIVIRLSSFE